MNRKLHRHIHITTLVYYSPRHGCLLSLGVTHEDKATVYHSDKLRNKQIYIHLSECKPDCRTGPPRFSPANYHTSQPQ